MYKHAEKILVIKLGALGDFIQAAGAMKAIRAYHPKAHLTLLTTEPYESLAQKSGYFDHIWAPLKPSRFNIFSWLKFRKNLNHERYDRVYDLQNNDRSNFYFKLLKNPKPEWVGAARGGSHRNDSPTRTAGHAFDGHVQTLGLAGIENISYDSLEWLDEDISGFDLKPPFVLLVPGCAPERPEKRWPATHYAELANLLAQQNFQPVIIGRASEEKEASLIAQQCPAALNLTDRTSLGQITALARKATGVIGNDTGPIHLIAATGCPTLALFSGASNIQKHCPKGKKVDILQVVNLEVLRPETVMKSFAENS